ncbi:MAG: hypothetical protein JWM11_5813 [Planctomycetaceae bacterium]|nr:hypothetical protein [Planctomycetaceae bacterium]
MAVPRRISGKSGPQLPRIPRVVVPRVWPYWDEDADPEHISTVIADFDSMWCRIARYGESLDGPTFHGPNAQFWIEPLERRTIYTIDDNNQFDMGPADDTPVSGGLREGSYQLDITDDMFGDGRIAVANYAHASRMFAELLAKPCWNNKKIKTYPPVGVLAVLMHEHFGSEETSACQFLMFGNNHEKAIGCLEDDRKQFIQIASPVYALFHASLIEQGLLSSRSVPQPTERDDEPSAIDIKNGILVFNQMGLRNPPIEAFRKAFRAAGFVGSNAKMGRILKAVKKQQK